jgi:putative Holliday junction resolvase
MKILAIDFGKKRMGFAFGDTVIGSETPLKQIERKNLKADLCYIENLVAEFDIEKIVIGYPNNMNGSKSKISSEIDHFAKKLRGKIAVPVDFVDERLTSFEAEQLLQTFKPNYKKRKEILDSISALIILRNYMENK